ncbi:MAG: hypothetical protein HZA19_06855 [Nitrospirae bacterium]|nr:hypothetical protein [Nitrospirota bacterium]
MGAMKPSTSIAGEDRLREVFGIEIVSLRKTGAGQMLDLRYRVVNSALAEEITKRNSAVEIRVVDLETGHVLNVPMTHLGMLRTRTPKPREKRTYYVLFANPGEVVKSGSEVSIRFGSVSVDGWRVE